MLVQSNSDLIDLETRVARSAAKALAALAGHSGTSALQALWRLKVDNTVGCDPLESERPLNLIEQLNQTFTYIASARAARLLMEWHVGALPLRMNLGARGGSDIESAEGGLIAAEVFAAVSTSNNRKLICDVRKVGATSAQHKYVFFMCPGVPAGMIKQRADVRIWSLGADL